MREKSTQEYLASISLPAPPAESSSAVNKRWTPAEIRRLERAINEARSFTHYGALAALMGQDRTAYQVAAKVNHLVRAGKLRQTSLGVYTIDE